MSIDDFVKTERQFLSTVGDAQINANGVYHYESKDGVHIISLDHYLLEYKQWLIDNNYVKPLNHE